MDSLRTSVLYSYRIEECIKSLLDMTTELTGQQTFLHPVDAINHVADNQLLEKMACYNPEPEQVNKLLKHVVSTVSLYLMRDSFSQI